MQRRTFLATTKTGLLGVLVERLPPGRSTLDPNGEPLDEIAKAIKELRSLDYRDGSFSVIMPASWLAGRLSRWLAGMPAPSAERTVVANLAADAAEVAGWASFEIGEYRTSLGWYDRAITAAGLAGNSDFFLFSRVEQARVLFGVGDDVAALRLLGTVRNSPAPADLHARAFALAARLHAGRGEERAVHQAIEAAMKELLAAPRSKDMAWSGVTGLHNVQHAQGAAMLDLGYFDRADDLLSAAALRVPTQMRRRRGTVYAYAAEAALRNKDPEKAAFQASQAYILLAPLGSRQRTAAVRSVMRELRERYGDTQFVREMDERMQMDSRYVLCQTSERRTRCHRRTCQYAKRGWVRSWSAAEHLDGAAVLRLAADAGYQACEACMRA